MSDLLAQTRLGLHVTREELTIWRQRAQSGPYKSRSDVAANSPDDWNRIEKNAEAFKEAPSSFRWAGPTLRESSGAVKKGSGDDVRLQNEPNGKALAHHIRDAAFVALVDEKRSDRKELKKAVKAELLHATTIRSLDFNNRTYWPATYYRDINPLFQTMNWFNNYLFAYDYLDIADKLQGEATFTREERARIEQWLLAAAEFAQEEQDWDVNRLFTNRSSSSADAAYTPARKWSASQRGGADIVTHYTASGPGHTIYGLMQTFNNRRMACHRYAALVGIKLGKQELVESAKRYVKDWIKYSVFTDGTMGEMERWSGSIPDLGWAYCTDVIASAVTIADALARTGDHSVYEYNTSIGLYGTQGEKGQTKNLHKTLKVMHKIAAKQVKWYGTNKKGNTTSQYLIDGQTDSWKALHDVWLTMANLKYKDKDIKAMYMRQGEGMTPYWSRPVGQGKHIVWTGDWGIFPGLLFMFGQMEDHSSPYSLADTLTIDSLTITTKSKQNVCHGENAGAAWVSVSGGVAPYSYLWSNGKTTASIEGLSAGTYTLTVTDKAGTKKSATLTISQPSALVVTESLSPETSSGKDGAIQISVRGGTGSYSYLWSTGATSKDVAGLTAGTYHLTVTDANGCQSSHTFNVSKTPASALLLSLNTLDPSCYGTATGKVWASVSGGVAPYSYLWSNGKTTASIEGLSAGTHTLTVTDKAGSKSSRSITLHAPEALSMQAKVMQESIAGKDASIDITVEGGSSPYSYQWSTGATTEDLSGLAAGTYTLTVTDSKGCQSSKSLLVESASASALQLSYSAQPVRCYGTASGSITLSVTGGVAPYSYLWSNGKTIASIDGLSAGSYTVTVTDQAGSKQIKAIALTQAQPLNIDYTATAETSSGKDGTITVRVSGGSGAYTYLWSTGATSKDVARLTAGTYHLTVTDANSCKASQTIVVDSNQDQPPVVAPLVLTANANDARCYGESNGAAMVSVTGGVAPYSYLWSNGKTTASIEGLSAGSYTVTVTDQASTKQTATLAIWQPSALQITETITIISAAGQQGAIDITVEGGSSPYSYQWSTGATTEDLSGLAAGTYTLTVTDSKGCQSSKTFNLPAQVPLPNIQSFTLLSAQHEQVLAAFNPIHHQDTINLALLPSRQLNIRANTTANAIDRVSFRLQGPAAFTTTDQQAPFYLLDEQAWTAQAGTYQLNATPYSKAGQAGESLTITFYVLDHPLAAALEPLLSCVQDNGNGTRTAYFGYVNHSKQLISLTNPADNFLSQLPLEGQVPEQFEPGQHERAFTVTFAAGSSLAWTLKGPDGVERKVAVTASTKLCAPAGQPLKPRMVFSPNADGIDDLWLIDNIEQYPGYEVVIFNRQGSRVFQAKPYLNNWDGNFQGTPLMPEAYFYVIKDSKGPIKTGPVTIIR